MKDTFKNVVRIDESKCNGCGACARACRASVIKIIDNKAKLVDEQHCDGLGVCIGKCPNDAITIEKKILKTKPCPHANIGSGKYISHQWPVQLRLIPEDASYLKNKDLVLLADCTTIAYTNLHSDIIKDRAVAMACPKFDDAEYYIGKLSRMIENNNFKSIEIVMMEVPCCRTLEDILEKALELTSETPLVKVKKTIITLDGERR